MLFKLWLKIPVVVRAVLLGIIIVSTATFVQDYLLVINAKTSPAIPWSFLLIALYMLLWVRFFSGGLVKKGSAFRKNCFRSTKPGKIKIQLGLVTGFFFLLSLYCLLFILFHSFTIPITLLPTEGLPAYSIFLNILAITAVAGISEEVGFRGYMQKTIEYKLGNKAAILITSLFFTLAHLGHAEFNYVLPVYFFFSVVMGIVTLHSNSLLPSIILHFVFDFAVFNSFWLLGKEAVTSQISVTGISTGYILLIAGFIIGLTGGVIFYRKLVAYSGKNKLIDFDTIKFLPLVKSD